MYLLNLRASAIQGSGIRRDSTTCASCFVSTDSVVLGLEQVRARLLAAGWRVGEIDTLRRVRRSEFMDDAQALQLFDLALTAGCAFAVRMWNARVGWSKPSNDR